MDYLSKKVTIFSDVGETMNPYIISVKDALDRIKKGGAKENTKNLCEDIRKTESKEKRNELKKQLPCVLYSGEFTTLHETIDKKTGEIKQSYRNDASLTYHSSLVVLDWDGINPHGLKSKLMADPYIFACFISPSYTGIKALVKIQDPDKHHDHYRAMLNYFKKYGELDPSSINPSRICYESYDPALYINTESWIFSEIIQERKIETQTSGIISEYDYSKVMPPVKMIRNAEIGGRNNQLVKASRLAGGYVSSGYIPEKLTKHIIKREYQLINPEEPEKDVDRAIENGIRYGKELPIYEFEEKEKEWLQEIGEKQIDFVIDFDKAFKELSDIRDGKTETTYTTGWSNLDPYFVWKKNSFIINLGHSNIGKTWLAFYMFAANAVNHGWKTIIYSAENKQHTQIRDLMQMVSAKKVIDMTQREFLFYRDFVREHFEFIDNGRIYSHRDILSMSEKLLSKKKFEYILIDPYNSLSRPNLREFGGTHEYDNQAAAEMLSWANSGTGIWLNIHTYTFARRDKDANGYSKRPFKDAAEGGGKWDSKSDTFVVSHRITNHDDVQERFVTDFAVEKERDTETGGKPHPYSEPFRIRLMYGTYFIDLETGERAFDPLQINLKEL